MLQNIINKLKTKRGFLTFLGVVAFIFVIVIGILTTPEPQRDPGDFVVNQEQNVDPQAENSLTIVTEPDVANVDINGIRHPDFTPIVQKNLAPGLHQISIVKPSHFTLSQEISIEKEEDKTLSYTLTRSYSFSEVFEGRLAESVSLLTSPQGATIPVYRNPRSWLLEGNKLGDEFAILREYLEPVMEVSWYKNQKAVVSTGALAAEKRDFIVDFDSAADVSDEAPQFRRLLTSGSSYDWNVDGSAVAFLGDINFSNGTARLFTYNTAPQDEIIFETEPALPQSTQIGSQVFTGVSTIYWMANNTFVLIQDFEGPEAPGTKTVLLYSEKFGSWEVDVIADRIPSFPVVNAQKNSIAYLEEGKFKIFNTLTGEIREFSLPGTIEEGLNYAFYDENTLLVAEPSSESDFSASVTFSLLDFENQYLGEGAVILQRAIEGLITEMSVNEFKDVILVTSAGQIFVFEQS